MISKTNAEHAFWSTQLPPGRRDAEVDEPEEVDVGESAAATAVAAAAAAPLTCGVSAVVLSAPLPSPRIP
jgi:hypothetical protein